MTEATYNSLPLTTEQRVELIKNQLANFETDKADMAAWIANLSDKQKAMHVAFWPEHALCICVDEQGARAGGVRYAKRYEGRAPSFRNGAYERSQSVTVEHAAETVIDRLEDVIQTLRDLLAELEG
jgi:hypothetical protein